MSTTSLDMKPVRRRGEWIALLVGILLGAPTRFIFRLMLPEGGAGSTILLPMAVMAAIAGAAAALHPQLRALPSNFAVYYGARVGARTGFLTALLSGGMTVLLAALLGQSVEGLAFMALLMSVLPATSVGMVAGGVVSWLRSPRSIEGFELNLVFSHRERRSKFALIHWAVAVFGYLSPDLLPFPLGGHPAPFPTYVYEKPTELASAEVWCWDFIAREQLAVPHTQGIALSPDGRFLAHGRSRGQASGVEVVNLDTRKTEVQISLSSPLSHLAFAPDGKRLFYVESSSEPRVGVIEIGTSRIIPLPRPKNAAVPDAAAVFWWMPEEVLFFRADGGLHCFGLEWLRPYYEKDSPVWKSQREVDRAEWKRGFIPTLPTFALENRFDLLPSVYFEPYPDSKQRWLVNEDMHLSIRHASRHYRRVFNAVDCKEADRVLSSSDGARFLRFRDDLADIFYFGVRATPPLTVSVKTDWFSETSEYREEISDALSNQQLCAFVCAPMVNPLNTKIVAPDRERIRALVRFFAWDNQSAQAWIEEDYENVVGGDILGDLHIWDSGKLRPIGPSIAKEAWVSISVAPTASSLPPARSDKTLLDRGLKPVITPQRGVYAFERLHRPARNSNEVESVKPAPTVPEPSSAPLDTNVRGNIESRLFEFVKQHHMKASAGDIENLMKDYQDPVIYAGKSLSIAELRERETQDHQKWTKVVETIDSIPTFVRKEAGWSVCYDIAFRNESSTGAWQAGKAAVELIVVPAVNDRFEITMQTARLFSQDSGRTQSPARASSPPPPREDASQVPITVPRPCWVGSFWADRDAGIKVTDALSTPKYHQAVLHRTIQQFAAGVPIRKCRAEYEGSAQLENGVLRVRIQEHGWAKGFGNSDFAAENDRFATGLVGAQIFFTMRGQDMVMPNGQGVLKHQK